MKTFVIVETAPHDRQEFCQYTNVFEEGFANEEDAKKEVERLTANPHKHKYGEPTYHYVEVEIK